MQNSKNQSKKHNQISQPTNKNVQRKLKIKHRIKSKLPDIFWNKKENHSQ